MESAALEATPAGCLFPDWIRDKGVSKSAAYQWRAALGIKPDKRRVGAKVEVWLSAADEQLMNDYREALAKMPPAEALAKVGRAAPVESDGALAMVPMDSGGISRIDPVESAGIPAVAPVESDGFRQVEQLQNRLAALRDAVELGAPLSTAEVSLLLGARPGGDEVVRGRLRSVREARNCWTIEPD